MDESTKLAIDIEIGHIEELFGQEGLIFAMELLKKKIKEEK